MRLQNGGSDPRPIKWEENWSPALIRGLATPCHDCISHALDKGYPRINRNGHPERMHRFLFKEKFGEIHSKIVVRHKCDNRKCINLGHLEIGTHADNNRDTMERGRARHIRGEDIALSKLTEFQVLEILNIRGLSQIAIAKKYGVRQTTISRILLRQTWRHVQSNKIIV